MITLKDREKGQRGMKDWAISAKLKGIITDAVDEKGDVDISQLMVDSNDGPRVWISTIAGDESKLMVNVKYDYAMYSGLIDLEVEEAEEE